METLKDNQLRYARIRPTAKVPTRSEENAGYDIYADFEEDYMVLPPHSTTLVPTGIASALSNKYYLQVYERGSTGSKGMKYSAGVIDPSYRGEIFIALSNVNAHSIIIAKADDKMKNKAVLDSLILDLNLHEGQPVIYPYEKAIAQLVVHKIHQMDVKEISYEELQQIPSDRGAGALGSSGK